MSMEQQPLEAQVAELRAELEALREANRSEPPYICEVPLDVWRKYNVLVFPTSTRQ